MNFYSLIITGLSLLGASQALEAQPRYGYHGYLHNVRSLAPHQIAFGTAGMSLISSAGFFAQFAYLNHKKNTLVEMHKAIKAQRSDTQNAVMRKITERDEDDLYRDLTCRFQKQLTFALRTSLYLSFAAVGFAALGSWLWLKNSSRSN